MPWSPEERRQLGAELDEVQRRLKIVYRYCLCALILLVTGFAVVLFRAFAHDVNRGFLNLYGGVAYVAFLAWAIGKLRALRPRPSDLPDVSASSPGTRTPGPGSSRFASARRSSAPGPGGRPRTPRARAAHRHSARR